MQDKAHAHNLTAQILSSYCQSGKMPTYTGDADGESLGRALGGAYQELFKHIVKANAEAGGKTSTD